MTARENEMLFNVTIEIPKTTDTKTAAWLRSCEQDTIEMGLIDLADLCRHMGVVATLRNEDGEVVGRVERDGRAHPARG